MLFIPLLFSFEALELALEGSFVGDIVFEDALLLGLTPVPFDNASDPPVILLLGVKSINFESDFDDGLIRFLDVLPFQR